MASGEGGRGGQRAVTWVVVVVLVCTVLLLPLVSGGFCADSPVEGASYCESHQRSIVGIDTSIRTWLVVTLVAAGVTWVVAARRAR